MTVKRPPGLFITGTNTGVGKTYVAATIARWLVNAGFRVGVYKPAVSGCRHLDATDVANSNDVGLDDDVLLWRAAGCHGDLARVSPQRFLAPLAPHLAAIAEGRVIDAPLLYSGIEYWRDRSDIVIVEGAGGLLSPITQDRYVADLAIQIGYPLIIVAANSLGVINQTLMTLTVAQSKHAEGMRVAGIVLNHPEPLDARIDPSIPTNRSELTDRCKPIPLIQLGFQAGSFEPPVDWNQMASS